MSQIKSSKQTKLIPLIDFLASHNIAIEAKVLKQLRSLKYPLFYCTPEEQEILITVLGKLAHGEANHLCYYIKRSELKDKIQNSLTYREGIQCAYLSTYISKTTQQINTNDYEKIPFEKPAYKVLRIIWIYKLIRHSRLRSTILSNSSTVSHN